MRFTARTSTFFHTLRGKLILTYSLVTVLALLALEVTFLLLGSLFLRRMQREVPGYLSDVISVLAPQARAYLQPGRSDLDGLQAWLHDTYAAGYASKPPQGIFDNPAAPIIKSEAMYVISTDRTILAAAPAEAISRVGKRYSPPPDVAGSEDALDNAMQLDLLSGHVSAMRPDGSYLVAVPVQEGQGAGPLRAVIIVTVAAPQAEGVAWWATLLGIVPATGLILLLAVAPFGALFGSIMSRGLTRRLEALTRAADAWSEGDFSVHPEDGAKDEISTLGMRMWHMAERIQALLHTQHEMALLEERNRLARELHDTVKQESFATLMQVRAARNLLERDPAAAHVHLEQAEAVIKSTQKELGLMISELRPGQFDERGLAGALGDYLETWSQQTGIEVDVKVQNERRLQAEIEQSLLRVARETLSNVARHSQASRVTVQLRFDPEEVSLCVADDGVGFDPAGTGSGFGLESMNERMHAIRGNLVVRAVPGEGTKVVASAPMLSQEQA